MPGLIFVRIYHFLLLFEQEVFKTCKNTIKLINLCSILSSLLNLYIPILGWGRGVGGGGLRLCEMYHPKTPLLVTSRPLHPLYHPFYLELVKLFVALSKGDQHPTVWGPQLLGLQQHSWMFDIVNGKIQVLTKSSTRNLFHMMTHARGYWKNCGRGMAILPACNSKGSSMASWESRRSVQVRTKP